MRDKVAVATVHGKAYFFIVNQLREHNIPFVSFVPGQPVPPKITLVISTEEEQRLVEFDRIFVYHGEGDLDSLVNEAKKALLGKKVFSTIVVGLDPGVAIGLVVLADGKVIEEGTCFSIKEVLDCIHKILLGVDFSQTSVDIKIGNGVPVYKDLLQDLDAALPAQVALEVVGEAGTNKPLKENKHSRGVRHISSATRIAARKGNLIQRGKTIATDT